MTKIEFPHSSPAVFVIGDLVHLKSGSPPLTVSMIEADGIVSVDWFVESDMRRDAFHPDELRHCGAEIIS